ncbi:putative Multidrug resistance pump [Zostera marina]|uniref:ribonuclease P n=1 Tax=Zostera marina TaxID=29655 RepID=A0A0K9NW37_ZOSMR|nr:putative Multidrug resistance pump [Zostera marina]
MDFKSLYHHHHQPHHFLLPLHFLPPLLTHGKSSKIVSISPPVTHCGSFFPALAYITRANAGGVFAKLPQREQAEADYGLSNDSLRILEGGESESSSSSSVVGGRKDGGFKRRRRNRSGELIVSSGLPKVKPDTNILKKEKKKGVKKSKKGSNDLGFKMRVGLDMCSKKGDVMGAISLYDSALKTDLKLDQYHYNVLLYLCSSASTGVILRGKSGSKNSSTDGKHNNDIHVSETTKKYALKRGFEIYERICSDDIPLSEAALTSISRMAMSMGNGDMAFQIVKKIKSLGLTLRLRSYDPALFTFCNNGDLDKAFEVENHMLDSNVDPEEPELRALLKLSIKARRSEKVYYLLQKLRTTVRQVSPSTAELIEMWFKSLDASRVGKRKLDSKLVVRAMENGGGGWHGLGWLGKGKWSVARTQIDSNGLCHECGEKLVAIDIDPIKTENFSRSVASIAAKREKDSSNFEDFQKWLEYFGPFEAVIDAANIGLFSQRSFSVTKVNAVVNGIRQKLPSKKWPLIIVHNRRIYGDKKINEPMNIKVLEKWKNADALYATPTGSNDDWYWLYAAVKCKALIVTNDEMRDHIFQTLGNDFFPKWKERHQVHFNFDVGGPEFQMPPACSVVIQETQRGHWHIPISSEQNLESGRSRTWLCVTRATFPSTSSCQELSSSPGKNREPASLKKKTTSRRTSRSTAKTSAKKIVTIRRSRKAENIAGRVEVPSILKSRPVSDTNNS